MFLEALITEINELISTTKNLYYKSLAKKIKKSSIISKKNIVQSLKHFITIKNPTSFTFFDSQYVCNQYPN